MSDGKNLHRAKEAKQDEYYTQLEDIENELKHYKGHFKGKTVLCNCDDPFESNFFKYFAMNFNHLGLKKLISTCYVSSPIMYTQLSLFDDMEYSYPDPQVARKKPYKVEITEVSDLTGNGAIDLDDIKLLLKQQNNVCAVLQGDGDFRSDECVSLLKEADIVVTNPPFSLFREYLAQLFEYNKKFVILGNKNAITFKEIFPYIKNNRMWIGMTPMSKELYFDVPKAHADYLLNQNRDRSIVLHNGRLMARAGAIWYTNLDIEKRHEEMILYKPFSSEEYKRYDNYDAINIDRTIDIPCDYFQTMGVPITFLDKYNPEQFEIVGLAPERLSENESSLQIKRYTNAVQHKKDGTTCSGNKVNDGPVIVHDTPPKKYPYYTSETVPDKYLEVLYARILIRRKEQK